MQTHRPTHTQKGTHRHSLRQRPKHMLLDIYINITRTQTHTYTQMKMQKHIYGQK